MKHPEPQPHGAQRRSSVAAHPGEDQPVRLWLVGSVSLGLVACVVAVLVYSNGSEPNPSETAPSDAGVAGPTRAPSASRGTARPPDLRLDPHRDAPLDAAPDPDLQGLQVASEAPEPEPNSAPRFDAEALRDPGTLKALLTSSDPALTEAVLQGARGRDKEIAARALLDIVEDGTEPRRLEVLQRLCASPHVDEETRMAALFVAVHDADDALVTQAVRELALREDPAALSLLTGAFEAGERPTKLFILESLASNAAAEPLLQQGVLDPDETVRSTAKGFMSLRTPSSRSQTESR